MNRTRRIAVGALIAVAGTVASTTVGVQAGAAAPAAPAAPSPAPLTNLAHLDFLTDHVRPPAQAGHTTYRLDRHPGVGVLWVYANHEADGTYQRVGGGAYDSTSDTYGQGAYDADDIARAAVVYVRHWLEFGDAHSRQKAFALLRGLTYLQTDSGPHAGDVVLWMQPDGTLNPSPTPKDSPDPSDAGSSYWLARTIWALGEAYAAFRHHNPAFASFLASRLDLAVRALHRDTLDHYGRYRNVDGKRMPAWLIVDGADASSEAVLGLAAYVAAGGPPTARAALTQLARGIARMAAGTPRTWPYGALLPSATSRSMWHAWGAQMPTALAQAARVLKQPKLLTGAISDAAVFTPHLLTATGPDNGWLPAPVDGSQIAYGADARVQGLLAVGQATGSSGLTRLAGIAAGWFFGMNPAGVATYDPATGATDDGVAADGSVNQNSGAESTIHGLLTMEALDAHPRVARLAHEAAHIDQRDGQRTVEAEAATLSGPATVVTPASAWTGESQYSGGSYVQTGRGAGLRWTVPPVKAPELVQAIVNRVPGRAGLLHLRGGGRALGTVRYGGGGAQGASPAPGALLPVTVAGTFPGGARTPTAQVSGGRGQLDALQLTPLLSKLVTSGDGHGLALVNSVATSTRHVTVALAGSGPATATSYDRHGRVWRTAQGSDTVTIAVPAGGFALARR